MDTNSQNQKQGSRIEGVRNHKAATSKAPSSESQRSTLPSISDARMKSVALTKLKTEDGDNELHLVKLSYIEDTILGLKTGDNLEFKSTGFQLIFLYQNQIDELQLIKLPIIVVARNNTTGEEYTANVDIEILNDDASKAFEDLSKYVQLQTRDIYAELMLKVANPLNMKSNVLDEIDYTTLNFNLDDIPVDDFIETRDIKKSEKENFNFNFRMTRYYWRIT